MPGQTKGAPTKQTATVDELLEAVRESEPVSLECVRVRAAATDGGHPIKVELVTGGAREGAVVLSVTQAQSVAIQRARTRSEWVGGVSQWGRIVLDAAHGAFRGIEK